MTSLPNRTGTLYAGTAATLTCSVSLDTSVDTSVTVNTQLFSPSGGVPGTTHNMSITVNTQLFSPSGGVLGTTHNMSISVSPLAEGQYSCVVFIAADTHLVQSDQVNDSLSAAGEGTLLVHCATSQSVPVPFWCVTMGFW